MGRRGPKGKSMKDRIAEQLADLEDCADEAKNVAENADLMPLEKVAKRFGEIQRRWMDRPPPFEGDGIIMEKLRESWERVAVTMMDMLEQILDQLHARIEAKNTGDSADPWTLTTELRVFEAISSQVALFRTAPKTPPKSGSGTPPALPQTEADLDRQIAELESKTIDGEVVPPSSDDTHVE